MHAKHIDIDCHFIRELVSNGKLDTKFVLLHLQIVDIFTKSLPRPLFEFLRSKVCVDENLTLCLMGVIENIIEIYIK